MSLQTRINKLFSDNPGVKPAHFAKFAGISRGAVSDWMSGNVKNISGTNGIKVGEYFGVDSEWVISGKGGLLSINEKSSLYSTNKLILDQNQQNISNRFSLWTDYCSNIGSNIEMERINMLVDKNIEVTDKCFILEINSDIFHELDKGIKLIVNPHADPRKNDVVVIQFKDDLPTLARYMPGMGEKHIEPLEKGYPRSISLENKHFSILGVVISAHPKPFKP